MNEMMSADDLVFDGENGYYIGMMSGTSLDALDVVLCRFDDDKPVIVATHSCAFDKKLGDMLLALCTPNGTQALAIDEYAGFSELDFWGQAGRLYAEFASDVVATLLQKANLVAEHIIAIGCHGQTVRHRPEWGFSLQLLDPNLLAERTGISVVSDFRRRDMAVGGQGAPLVPAFHQAMFGDDANAVVLNLGGIANITVLGETVLGYDTGVANLLMDAWANRHLGVAYDKGGEWAKSGTVNQALLDALLAHEFLQKPAPKSTGREDFNLDWLDGVLAKIDPDGTLALQDVQATLCEFTAVSACDQIAKFAHAHTPNHLYVCGGGAYNEHLLARLSALLGAWQVQTSAVVGIEPTWVEALAFAWLARQTMLMQTSNLPAVTGADKAVVLGVVCFA